MGADGRKQKKIVLGLTGNIASGKSTVCNMLERLGADIIDTDKVAHAVMGSGPVPLAIARRFGAEVLKADGSVDRTKLGPIVFSDPAALADLDRIVHPAVVRATEERVAASTAPVVVVDAVKLIEAGIHKQCDQIWVVVAPPEQQANRLMRTRTLGEDDAWLRIRAQTPIEEKLHYADTVVDNGGTLDQTWEQVNSAYERLTKSKG